MFYIVTSKKIILWVLFMNPLALKSRDCQSDNPRFSMLSQWSPGLSICCLDDNLQKHILTTTTCENHYVVTMTIMFSLWQPAKIMMSLWQPAKIIMLSLWQPAKVMLSKWQPAKIIMLSLWQHFSDNLGRQEVDTWMTTFIFERGLVYKGKLNWFSHPFLHASLIVIVT